MLFFFVVVCLAIRQILFLVSNMKLFFSLDLQFI